MSNKYGLPAELVLGGVVDTHGSTYISITIPKLHISVALTKQEGECFKVAGDIPGHVLDKFRECLDGR